MNKLQAALTKEQVEKELGVKVDDAQVRLVNSFIGTSNYFQLSGVTKPQRAANDRDRADGKLDGIYG